MIAMCKKLPLLALVVAAIAVIGFARAADVTGLRGPTPLDKEAAAGQLLDETNTDRRRGRNYPEQPPVIPHAIRGYEISLQANKCLTCHGRQFTEESQAPMISVTHFMDRNDQILATVSARRYFCNQCHVPQTDAKPLVDNKFIDIDALMKANAAGKKP